ncbi:LAFE_0B03950g1_1 [Lachancea fermentati]|uniref:LAFE_0B03950g1_1 n=1 Tax=Lachancea fermentati TaxID=4955 RepID=A0A1G4M7N4_LACFM|nr:LAFE_0B03950g1_1 [Lachancea fermentati]
MSDYEALLQFNRTRVSLEMVYFLASTTASIIQVRERRGTPNVSLVDFIKGLITRSNVQTPTLMSTAVYLTRLRSIIPASVYGIESTRHRIFLGCLILAAKNLNDSSPLNKHWASYTDGLLDISEVNTIERELLEYFDWNLKICTQDLTTCLAPFLKPIKDDLVAQKQDLLLFNSPLPGCMRAQIYEESHSRSSSSMSIPSLVSSATMSTISTTDSRRTPIMSHPSGNIYCIKEEDSHHIKNNSIQSSKDVYDIQGKHISDKLSSGVSHNSQGRKKSDSMARPIILKTGLTKPVNNMSSSSSKFGLRSNWASIFK